MICLGRVGLGDLHLTDDAAHHVRARCSSGRTFRSPRTSDGRRGREVPSRSLPSEPQLAIRDVQEDRGLGCGFIIRQNDDLAALQHEEEALRAIGWDDHGDGLLHGDIRNARPTDSRRAAAGLGAGQLREDKVEARASRRQRRRVAEESFREAWIRDYPDLTPRRRDPPPRAGRPWDRGWG